MPLHGEQHADFAANIDTRQQRQLLRSFTPTQALQHGEDAARRVTAFTLSAAPRFGIS